jgi:uncharacterized repeat protein (TIGR01451 family)
VWTALFLLSLLMQYGALANPSSALAVHGENLFQLDGNAVTDPAPPAPVGDDWDKVFNGTSSANSTQFITDPVDSDTDQTFTGGSTKDDINTTSWLWKFAKASQAKNDITNAFAAAYTDPQNGHTIAYFGLNKFEADGDNFVGFWFFKNQIAPTGDGNPPGSPFSAGHAVGDILILADYTNGGTLATFSIYEWVGTGGDVNGTLHSIASGVPCTGGGGDVACGATNGNTETAPWPFDGRDGDPGVFPPGTLFEGGVDLTQLGLDTGCFTTFLAETRASQSVDATLSDFAYGNFSFCVTPTISTQVSGSSITIGGAGVTDTAHLSGTKGVPTGTVDFFLCGPTGSAANCTTGGVDAGQDKVVNGSGDATSNAMSPTTAGWYCFRAEYTPAQGSHYLPASHTNNTTECFEVLKASPTITTAENQAVLVGNTISDSATLSGGFNPTGTITFRAYGPDDATCAAAAVFISAPVAVNNGNNTYGPVSFSPAVAGVYRWIATYSGDANNNGVAGLCNDTGETDTVNKVSPTIATSANETVTIGASISDSATLSGGLNPTGTITFRAYGPDDATCAGAPAFVSAATPVAGGGAGPVSFVPTAVGVYRWIASYSGDANNNPVVGLCNAAGETDTVVKTNPLIATVLHGGGQDGTSITVPLGTAVTDSSTLTGATADAGGSVHYQVFSDSQCQSLAFDAGTKLVTNSVVPNSSPFTINVAGTYYWQADYSGDAKNNAASSACNLEIVTVPKNIPAISTTANESVVIGNAIHDTASLTDGFNPTGTITFKAWGPANDTCAGNPVFQTTVDVDGNGPYGPVQFTPGAPGSYHWIASYSGDANNAAVSGGCGDAGENDTVIKASPTIATVASGSVVVGGQITDTATVSGGFSPTGIVTFNLYGPGDTSCAGPAIFTDTAVLAAGVATSDPYTTTAAGTYRWVASYGGDVNNNPVAGNCNDANESVVVTKDSPAISTDASASVVVGGLIWDVATLSDGFNPTGTITFHLYGPDDASCATSIFTDTATVLGNGQYTSDSFTTAAAGTYRWVASYGGDANNDPVAGNCNDENESVVVTKAQPEIATQATEGGIQGDPLSDTATVSGGFNPTGSVTFTLYASNDPTCDGDPIFTSTVALGQGGTATSGTFAAPGAGSFHWIASYSGDANNDPVAGTCGDEGETTIIRQFAPDITTTLHSGELSGAELSVLFGSDVFDTATLTGAGPTAGGTVEYTVFSDSECSDVYADAGTKSVVNGSVPASDSVSFPDPGTYYWQAHYSGDANNAPATSACQDEVLTVTTPNLHAVKLVATNDGEFGPTSTAEPGDTLTFQITVTNSGDGDAIDVPVTDDINPVLTHASFVSCSDGCDNVAGVLSWTIPLIEANGGSEVVTFEVELDADFPVGVTELPNVVVVVGPGSNCEEESEDADCDTNTTVNQPALTILKDVSGFTGGTAIDGTPIAKIGDTLTYTLTYDITSPPAHNGVITDVVPVGLAYVDASATTNAEFTLVNYNAPTHTLTWNAALVTVDGSLSFKVTVLATAPDQVQPIDNVATIESDDTAPDNDDAKVLVQQVQAATGTPLVTPPTTDTIGSTTQAPTSNAGFSLMLVLLALAAFVLSLGYITPAPERARRRTEGRRR